MYKKYLINNKKSHPKVAFKAPPAGLEPATL